MADSQIHVALAGNPNCGKTTLFNLITGANGYVGNWPGVTVEKKEAKLLSDRTITIADLPGIYSAPFRRGRWAVARLPHERRTRCCRPGGRRHQPRA
ncbi:MAG: FeoB small GTPase domain-containing protein [Collinsella sp.]